MTADADINMGRVEPSRELAGPLFQRGRVTPVDQRRFILKLAVLGVLLSAGVTAALSVNYWLAVVGVLILGLCYPHMVELQHQCLHHTAFVKSKWHRIAGVPLGLPMLVGYSHYRQRHLQHHKSLGTPDDSEFFGFDKRAPVTLMMLVKGSLDVARFAAVFAAIGQSVIGRWHYECGVIPARRRNEIIHEYWAMGALLAIVVAASISYGPGWALRLWILPLFIAIPVHFFVELPEHVLCDTESTDVLRNTRSITGSSFSTWYTNGNNLHIEHHAAMSVPINRLRERHEDARSRAKFVDTSYPAFFRQILSIAAKNTFRRP